MINAEDLVLRYSAVSPAAVNGLTFFAGRGELTAIVGPNGSGKSTIVRALLGLVQLAGGKLEIDGASVAALTRREVAQRLAVVPQREEITFPSTVRDYVSLGRMPFQSTWRASSPDDASRVMAAMARAGVLELASRPTNELSGGEWQRSRIARALAQAGDGLVLDEPSTFLDVAHEMAVFELAKSLAESGMAVLMVSHQINLVSRFADKMILLNNGELVVMGSPAEVMRAELLEGVYGWPLVVTRDPAIGAPTLVPLRRR